MTSPYITEAVRRAKLPISVDTLVFRGRTYIQVANLVDPADGSLTPNVKRSRDFYIDLRTRLEQSHESL